MDQIPPGTDLTKTPAGPAPMGVESNLIDPPSLATPTFVVTAVMILLASIFVVIRLSSIVFSGRRTAWDDYTCFIGFVLITAFSGLVMAFTNVARHIWDIPLSYLLAPSYLRFIFAQNILQAPAVGFAKSSILLLYLRIFTVKPSMRYAIYAGLIFTAILYGVHIPLVIGFCSPRGTSKIIDFASCAKLTVWGPVQGFLAMILDVYIFILPFPVISQLKLPRGKRLGVYVLFGTAICGIVASTLAEVYRFEQWFHREDQNWHEAKLFICIIVEGYIAVIVGSMPALAAFFRSPAVSNSSFFQYVRSHVSTHIFHTGHTNPSAKVSKTSGSSGTKRSYTRTNSDTESNAHLRDDQDLQLNDVPMSNAKAYSHANGPNRDIEEGIIKKSVAIKQSQQSL
ncbi:MAG: hypothetical protein LQ349_004798 [Xanthoria aureola]|nr:MAG: hypothetical protein LQ349_004798 [Xanthoria aureola]